MALIHCHFFSHILGIWSSMNVILPQPEPEKITRLPLPAEGPFRTLYLLHGLSDDHTGWQRRTSIERYVEGKRLAVVMPAVGRSFYHDLQHGGRYWTFISQELPAIARALFPLSVRREDTFAAGLSMGGYGAFRLALNCPDQYAAAASLSGALDLVGIAHEIQTENTEMRAEFVGGFGDPAALAGSPADLFAQAARVAKSELRPRLWAWCGTEDGLLEQNRRFHDHAVQLGLDLTYSEGPGGHTWDCWDAQIQQVVAWIDKFAGRTD